MRVLDHSAIYLLIAGTYTPLSVLVLEGALRPAVLSIVWSGAAAGCALNFTRASRHPAPAWALYLGLGWVAVLATPQIVRNLDPGLIVLLVAGGVLYTAGAVLFAMRRPVLRPKVFGFHEVWHSFVLGASACHYALVLALVAAAR